MDKKFNFQELQAIVATLRGENGCPWDKSQTHESLKLYTLEEAYEVNQAVSNLTKTGDCTNLKEELGDLLFQVLLQSQVAEDNGEFAIEDVIDGEDSEKKFSSDEELSEKLGDTLFALCRFCAKYKVSGEMALLKKLEEF